MLSKNSITVPTVDEGPYRTDPIRVANEALQVATEVRDLAKSNMKELERRVLDLEYGKKQEHGFIRTNWTNFWSFLRSKIDFVFSWEVLVTVLIASVVAFGIYAIWDSSKSGDNTARQACQRANMTLVDSSNCRVTCIRPDSAVLVITTCGDDRSATLTVPNQ